MSPNHVLDSIVSGLKGQPQCCLRSRYCAQAHGCVVLFLVHVSMHGLRVCLEPGVGGSAVHSCARVYTLQRVHFLFTAIAHSAMRLNVLELVEVHGLVLHTI